MKIVAIIPARLESTRLPRKLLCDLEGKSILHRTCEAVANTSLFDEVWVACDHELLREEATRFGFKAVLTCPNHESGTDRIAEVAKEIKGDIFINVQADEPFIDKVALEKVISLFQAKENIDVATLKRRIDLDEQIYNPNCVKVVTNENGKAIYFSRAPIPFDRDGKGKATYFQHIGVYGFTRAALLRFTTLKPTWLEQIEKLENLRMLENDFEIYVDEIEHVGISIDTQEDLVKARAFLRK
jgi:3-deoxy-manno-octulosonate cytidylyltransferase (CMP-KDO synthetase)